MVKSLANRRSFGVCETAEDSEVRSTIQKALFAFLRKMRVHWKTTSVIFKQYSVIGCIQCKIGESINVSIHCIVLDARIASLACLFFHLSMTLDSIYKFTLVWIMRHDRHAYIDVTWRVSKFGPPNSRFLIHKNSTNVNCSVGGFMPPNSLVMLWQGGHVSVLKGVHSWEKKRVQDIYTLHWGPNTFMELSQFFSPCTSAKLWAPMWPPSAPSGFWKINDRNTLRQGHYTSETAQRPPFPPPSTRIFRGEIPNQLGRSTNFHHFPSSAWAACTCFVSRLLWSSPRPLDAPRRQCPLVAKNRWNRFCSNTILYLFLQNEDKSPTWWNTAKTTTNNEWFGRNSPMRTKGSNISNKQLAYWYIVLLNPFPLIFWVVDFYIISPAYSLGNSWKLAFSSKPFLHPFGHYHLRFIAALHVYLRMAVSRSFLCLSLLPLPSWHHPQQTDQTPSLYPCWTDVVALQIQHRQSGVLFEAFCQGLTGDTWLQKHDMKHTAHILPQTCEKSHHSSSHLIINSGFMQENPLCQGNLLPDWKSRLTIYNFYKELFWAILEVDFSRSWTCQVVLTANIAQPNTKSWPVHNHLSCLIPLLPYTNFTSWESPISSFRPLQHPFHRDDIPWS